MKDHYVIAGWNEKGIEIIKQLHAEDFVDHRHIVVLAPEQAKGLPHHHKLVQVVHGERTDEDSLNGVNISAAHSAIILADSAEAVEDARTILTILAIRKICSEKGLEPIPVIAEIVDSRNVKLAQYAGVELDGKLEIVSSSDVGRRLLTQAAVHPGLSTVYNQLLEFKKDNSEIHSAKVKELPESFSFDDLVQLSLERRPRAYVTPIGIQHKGRVHINPSQEQVRKLEAGDVIFALCDSPKDLDELLKAAAKAPRPTLEDSNVRALPQPS